MSERFSYQTTTYVPPKYFKYLPKRVRRAMVTNMVSIANRTGSATFVGDDVWPTIYKWCNEHCAHRWCLDGSLLMFESPEDKTLFMTARPQ